MQRRTLIFALAALIVASLACDMPGGTQAPTPTLFVMPTLPPTNVPPSPTVAAIEPTVAPPTTEPPTAVPTQSGGFPTPTAVQQGGGTVSRVQIYMIALEDNGKSGDPIGCGDTVVPVEIEIKATQAPLRAAMEALLSQHGQFYGQSGLYNVLYNSKLQVGTVTIDAAGTAKIGLTGTFSLAGECDDPRFEAQLTYTARQFSTVQNVEITINGTPLHDLIYGVGPL
jgi:sporulation and spore germination protein